MSKITEVIDSLNDENASEVKEQLLQEANALNETNRQLYNRAKKAEGFENKDGKWVKKEVKQTPAKKTQPEETSELDYGKKAFLNANGIRGAEEMAKVLEFMGATGKSLDEVVDNKYFQAELKDYRDDLAAKGAMPSSNKGGGSSNSKDSAEYWINKGEMPPKDKPELQRAYVNARYQKEKGGNPF